MDKRLLVKLAGIIFLSFGCHSQRTTQNSMLPAFDKEGHRGCRGLMPENTIPAMLKAIDLGVTTLEMDAVITKDSQVILSHEPFFNHAITTKPDGTSIDEKDERNFNIYQMTYAETQQYDVGKKLNELFPGQKKMTVTKPLLGSVIDRVEAYVKIKKIPPVFYNIETKSTPATDDLFHPSPAVFVELLMEVILKKGIQDHVIIQSFDFRTLQYLHRHYPAIKTSMLIEGNDTRNFEDQLAALGFTPTIYSPDYSLVNEELLRRCHAKKIKVIPWTVNDKPIMDNLKRMGVDGIITDYPDLFNK
jgi:glycerophosphoryl diester phosphodiesterase